MRLSPLLAASLAFCLPGPAALAHPGHLIELAGHNHWLGGAAIGLAIAISLWKAGKPRSEAEDPAEPAEDPETEPQEA